MTERTTEGDSRMSDDAHTPEPRGAAPVDPWAPPGSTAPLAPAGPPAPPGPGPGAGWSGAPPVPGGGYDRPTAHPAAADAPPWANPFAPPEDARPAPGEHVPPPPIAPDGPGRPAYAYGHTYGGSQPPAWFGGPAYGWPAAPVAPSNGMGTAGLVLGIVAAVVFCLWPLAIVLGVLGVVFGALGRARARRGEATNGGQALAGIICGAVGIALGAALLVMFFVDRADDGDDGPVSDDGGYSATLLPDHLG
ncbi:DUF4190 domain-containing protein [Streptomyces sp. NPDC008313]|uniref:DUF4190 domain-containing protein n=1 Tax=Streptomyces sp. NPDC008313 TaxID=3364826 RepID=UPI0036E4A49D